MFKAIVVFEAAVCRVASPVLQGVPIILSTHCILKKFMSNRLQTLLYILAVTLCHKFSGLSSVLLQRVG